MRQSEFLKELKRDSFSLINKVACGLIVLTPKQEKYMLDYREKENQKRREELKKGRKKWN